MNSIEQSGLKAHALLDIIDMGDTAIDVLMAVIAQPVTLIQFLVQQVLFPMKLGHLE